MKAFATEVDEHVATLWLANPDRRNAMGPEFWDELPAAVTALADDERVRAVVLAAKGPHFSVGLDLVRMAAQLGPVLSGGQAKERLGLFDLIHRMRAGFDRIAESRKPFIAAVHGACIGGGLDLVAACDVRVASRDARFSLREAKIAIVADMGSLQRLRGVVPEGWLRELALTGRDVDAATAERIGLANRVVEGSADEVVAEARALAREIAANSPLAVAGTKEILNHGARYGADASLRYVAAWNAAHLASADLMEAVSAFAAKRAPAFKGE